MGIKITQSFEYNGNKPLVSKDVINSYADYTSHNPLVLDSTEISELNKKYNEGYIVYDNYTDKHYKWMPTGWQLLVDNSMGSQGAQGAVGAQGATGLQGAQGATGLQGATGAVKSITIQGSGNAITNITGTTELIATKGTIFLTEHPIISKSTDTTSTQSVAHQDSFTVVDSVTRDSNGHVTKINTKTVSLQTPKSLTVGGKTYDGSTAVTINASDLGLDSALKYHGVTTTALTDGATTNPIVINGANHTATTGCVVFYGSKEFVFNGSKWYELGDGSNHKIKQTAVASPSASGSTAAFIDTISQDANGQITATKKNVSVNITANATDDDVVILTGSGGANSVTYDAKHAQKGPSSGYTSGNTTTSISGSGGTIKIPQITVDKYGHVTAADDESVTITMPTKLSDLTDDVVEGNYLPMAESTYDTTDSTNVLKHDGTWGIPELAEDLGGREETHHEEFFFQPTAGNDLSIKDGYAKIKSLKGNTIVWNQICINGNFENYNSWIPTTNANISVDNNIATVTTSSNSDNYITQKFNFIINHKYYISLNTKSSSIDTVILFIFFGEPTNHIYKKSTKENTWEKQKILFTSLTNTHNEIRLQISNVNVVNQYKNIRVHDLTQMFGEGNEPTIEEFEAMYPDDYYEYNEGELRSFNGSAIKSVGFNQWDEEWENGTIDYNGNFVSDSNAICSKHYIKVLPDTKYYMIKTSGDTGFYACFNEKYENILPSSSYLSPMNGLKYIPANCHYIKFFIRNTSTYNNNVCINLSHSGYRNGQYEPYKESILQLPIKTIKDNNGDLLFPDGMKSAGTAYDEILYDEGLGKYKAIKRIGSVDMGTLLWFYDEQYKGYRATLGYESGGDYIFKGVCAKYPYKGEYYIVSDKELGYIYYSHPFIKDSSYTDLNTFRQSLQGQILYYELETPIEVILDNIDLSYEAWDFGTEELLSDVVTTPVITETQYNFNAVDMIRNNYFAIKALKKANTDTQVTNTKNNTTTFYLTGTTSASTNTGTQIFDSTVYVSGTEGQLHAKELQAENSVQVGNSIIQYNTTTGCLEIIT